MKYEIQKGLKLKKPDYEFWDQGDQMILKKNQPIFWKVAQTTQIMPKYKPYFYTGYFGQNVINLYIKMSPFLAIS